MIGKTISHYRIIEKLGQGGMGEVFLAQDTTLDRRVALKFLPDLFSGDPERLARFEREAKLLGSLNHPNIATIYGLEQADGKKFLAMELVEGQTLADRMEQGALPTDEVLEIGRQIAEGLEYAHEHGVIHRDLKPANVKLRPDGVAKVLDFGLARQMSHGELVDATTMTQGTASLTEPGMLVGTLAYMAPEQLRGQTADTRSDVWALGVMLQEMATGKRPFKGNTPFELSSAILSSAAAPLSASVPVELQTVIEHCLRKEPGQRYRRASEVHAALEAVQSGKALPHPRPARSVWMRRHWVAVAAAAVVFLAVAVGILVGVLLRRIPGSPAAPTQHALAVLPLKNLSGDPEQKYFVDGLTDALIDDIARVGGALRVIARSSTEIYAANPKPIAQVARELGVDAIVEGSVAREGSLVRVTASLIDSATEKRLWSERYERNLTSVLALQADIARAVAQAVKGALSPEDEQKLARMTREVNPKVFDAYTKGMYFLNQSVPDALEKGMAYLHQAVELDPNDPLVYAGLADGYITLAHGANPPKDAFLRARTAARTAVELDGTLPQSVFALGAIKGYLDWDWPVAIATMRRTIDLNASFAMAHYHLAWFLVLQGQMQEAIAEHIKAREADPLNPLMTAWLGELYRWNGQYDLAIAEAKKAIELGPKFPPSHYVMGLTYADQGQWDKAIEAMRQASEADPAWRWAVGAMQASAGRTTEARRMLAELAKEPVSSWTALWRGTIHASLGERDAAFRWLSYEPHHIWTPWWFTREVQVFTKPLHGDPRFREMQRKMNVPALEM